MNDTQIEFPAYNIFYRYDGEWRLYGRPVIGKKSQEIQSIAKEILFGSHEVDAVRIYGIFNCQQTFIKEIRKSDMQASASDEDRMRTAIKSAIAICDDECASGESSSEPYLRIRDVLSSAITSGE